MTVAAFHPTGITFVPHRLISFCASHEHSRGTNCRSGGTVRAIEDNGSVRLSGEKQIGSGSAQRSLTSGGVLQSCPWVGRDHGNRKPYSQRSSSVWCSVEEKKETPPEQEEMINSVFGKPSPRRERIYNKTPGATAAGKSLEFRLLQRLGQTLIDRHLLRPGQSVLLAVSGGQDSVCLMHLMVKLQSMWGWKIGIAHCDHQWSSSARKQAAHVAQMAQGLGLDYYQALTTEPVLGEGVARTWRYGTLQRIAVSHGYEAIVTAHTASDRIETLLFNIFRGSGLQGLQSLTWKRALSPELSLTRRTAFQVTDPIISVEDPQKGTVEMTTNSVSLVRPLLDVTRTELRELMQELGLPLWPDPSNLSMDIGRNRIRHELLPYLRKHFNSGVDKSLARWAEILHGEQVYLDHLCENIRVKAESEFTGPGTEEGGKKLDVSLLRSLPIGLQRRILKQFTDGFTGKSLGFDTVERVRRACAKLPSARTSLQLFVPGGYCVRICSNELIVARCPAKEMRK